MEDDERHELLHQLRHSLRTRAILRQLRVTLVTHRPHRCGRGIDWPARYASTDSYPRSAAAARSVGFAHQGGKSLETDTGS